MQNEPRFLYTDGNLSLFWEGEQHSIGDTHPNFEAIIEALNEERWEDLNDLLSVRATVARELDGVEISDNGDVTFNGRPIHNTLADRIVQFMQRGLPWQPLARFLSNLMENPSNRAVNELYSFLENQGIALTPDGCFLAYKGVRSDFMDVYSGTFDNNVGQIHEMPRNEVDDDADRTCSNGFHVGAHKYATSWAGSGNVMLVKVNPRDAVSVPADHDAQKLRVCRYEVVEIAPPAPIEEPLVMAYADEENYEVEISGDEQATGRTRGEGGRFMPGTVVSDLDDDDYEDGDDYRNCGY